MAKQRCSYRKIVAELRARILSGKMEAGQRLPTRRELLRQFQTTTVTVNRALQLLIEHGFVVARGRHGTYVAEHPPHVAHFAIAFPWGPDHAPSQFFRAIQHEAAKFQQPERKLFVFHGIYRESDDREYQRLVNLVTGHRIGGLLLPQDPYRLRGTPLLDEPRIPRVGIMLPSPASRFPTAYPDVNGFVTKAFAHLAGLGRRRVALVILGDNATAAVTKNFIAAARSHRLTIHPWWIQGSGLEARSWVRQSVQALFAPSRAEERPNGLVIMDDNLVEPATEGVSAARVSVPEELEIVAQTNFPWPAPSAVPVTRLGYDITRLVAICLDRIEQQSRGEAYPQHTAVPALFESELAR